MANYNSGQVKFGTPGSQTALSLTQGSRRLYDFSDRVAELAPEESPFFVYLSKVGKVPTTDSQFRFLEDRTKIAITDRSFTTSSNLGAIDEDTTDTMTISSSPWLIKGMVVMVSAAHSGAGAGSNSATCVITAVNSATEIEVRWLRESSVAVSIDGSSTAVDCQVIGTAYAEGSGAPDVWSQELDHDYGYTQIFKTACEMSNTARATVYKGYADEWQRIWNLKLREHKVDIERAMLFGQRASVGGVQYSEGIVGHIIAEGSAPVADTTQLSYSEGKAYHKSIASGSMTYDNFLSDLEVVFDPARGGGSSKLALASLPVISLFNKLGASGFVDDSFSGSEDNPGRYMFERSNGTFGHKIMKIETVHGDLTLVKEPLFRGLSSNFLAMVDLDHVSYRPLVGNGVNRDTSITTNVQQADEDLRKDMILTEAGLEISLPETHALFNIEGA
tara:strand:- start:19178 stop:20515 length:1338 start_codon:yes stop_codon:yes gene_type:complete